MAARHQELYAVIGRAIAGSVAAELEPSWALKNQKDLGNILRSARQLLPKERRQVIDENCHEIEALTDNSSVAKLTHDGARPLLYSILDVQTLADEKLCQEVLQTAIDRKPQTARTQVEPVIIVSAIGLGVAFFQWLKEREKTKQEKIKADSEKAARLAAAAAHVADSESSKSEQGLLKVQTRATNRKQPQQLKTRTMENESKKSSSSEDEEEDEEFEALSFQEFFDSDTANALSHFKDLALGK